MLCNVHIAERTYIRRMPFLCLLTHLEKLQNVGHHYRHSTERMGRLAFSGSLGWLEIIRGKEVKSKTKYQQLAIKYLT